MRSLGEIMKKMRHTEHAIPIINKRHIIAIATLVALRIVSHEMNGIAETHPSTLTALIFWCFSIAGMSYFLWWALRLRKVIARKIKTLPVTPILVGLRLMLIGAVLNAIVILANGGHMPVLDSILEACIESGEEITAIYIPASTGNLVFLGDIFVGASVGDIIVLAGQMMVRVAVWIYIIKIARDGIRGIRARRKEKLGCVLQESGG